MDFEQTITTVEELRQVIAPPSDVVLAKEIGKLDEHCRDFISRSPFVIIASTDGAGSIDASPKGDPPGFVKVLDDTTLAIPERPGNHRADTLVNLLRHPHVGVIFLIPGTRNTLRVRGSARIVRDRTLLDSMAVGLRGNFRNQDDNFHYQDESERYKYGEHDTYEQAVEVCMEIVEGELLHLCEQRKSAAELYSSYTSFGIDPFIKPGLPEEGFSAWDYARQRCQEICANNLKVQAKMEHEGGDA